MNQNDEVILTSSQINVINIIYFSMLHLTKVIWFVISALMMIIQLKMDQMINSITILIEFSLKCF